jgi:eukaryotic-like serine/threonine-protein kinase
VQTQSEDGRLQTALADTTTRGYGSHEGPLRPLQHTRLGRYVLLEELGHGGMGVVWTAYDPKLDRKVAIKLLKGSARTSLQQARFIREAQALAKLSHPNIVTVHDVDSQGAQLYMAMEYIDGQTLERWLRTPRGWREILAAFDQAGQGLAAAHAAGITHRDFKPSNVLVAEDGRIKVLDFGLAKHMDHGPPSDALDPRPIDAEEADAEAEEVDPPEHHGAGIMAVIESSAHQKLTKVGRLVGTPAYMAPEQHVPDANTVGAWTDQFSFAVALYEALFGVLPFEGRDPYEVCENVRAGRFREPRREGPVPGWVLRVLQRALRYEPEQRYPSMPALLAALRADPARRRRLRLAYAGGAVLLGLVVWVVARPTPEAEPPPRPCRGASERLVGVWDDHNRVAVERGLLATRRTFAADTAARVTTELDRYAEAWVAQHTAICEATRIHGEQSEALLDVRMTCLDRRRSELGALVAVLATPEDRTVATAVAAVAGLRRPEPCAAAQPGVESDLPVEPARRHELFALQARIDDAGALLAAGRHAEARDRAGAAGRSAAEAGFLRLLAQARVIEGTAHERLGELGPAQDRLREGIAVASEVADVRTEFDGWIDLLFVAGVLLDEPERAADWQFAAENALRRAGSPKDLEFELALTTGGVLLAENRLEDAARVGEAALRSALEANGSGSVQHAQALGNLGIVAAKRSEWDLAERRLRESHQLHEQLLGADHPQVASDRMNLANVLLQRAKDLDEAGASAAYDQAEQLYAQVVATHERNDGPSSKSVARALAMLGLLQINRGKLEQARSTHERVLRSLRALPDAEDDLASALVNLGKLERLEQHHDRAEAHYREALALQTSRHGEAHLGVSATRLKLCRVLEDAERPRQALAECKRALAILEASGGAPSSRADAHTLIAEVNESLGDAPEAAKQRALAAALQRPLQAQP